MLSRIEKIENYLWPPISLGDIAYWDGSTVKTVSQDKWDTSLGTPVGVVVIPSGMLPDGKARIVSLSSGWTNKLWESSDEPSYPPIPFYAYYPITNNTDNTSTAMTDSISYFPSDNFTGSVSYVDPNSRYYYTDNENYIPSPYLGNNKTLNADFCKELPNGNVLSDFNGLENTSILNSSTYPYAAAKYCWNYSDGVSNLQWYLPAMGELAFLVVRNNIINKTLQTIGSAKIENMDIWSATCSGSSAFIVNVYDGSIDWFTINETDYDVVPFAILN